MTNQTLYVIVKHPGTPPYDIWPVGDGSDPDQTAAYVDAARQLTNYPEEMFPEGWDISVSGGMPHETLLAQATLHDEPPVAP